MSEKARKPEDRSNVMKASQVLPLGPHHHPFVPPYTLPTDSLSLQPPSPHHLTGYPSVPLGMTHPHHHPHPHAHHHHLAMSPLAPAGPGGKPRSNDLGPPIFMPSLNLGVPKSTSSSSKQKNNTISQTLELTRPNSQAVATGTANAFQILPTTSYPSTFVSMARPGYLHPPPSSLSSTTPSSSTLSLSQSSATSMTPLALASNNMSAMMSSTTPPGPTTALLVEGGGVVGLASNVTAAGTIGPLVPPPSSSFSPTPSPSPSSTLKGRSSVPSPPVGTAASAGGGGTLKSHASSVSSSSSSAHATGVGLQTAHMAAAAAYQQQQQAGKPLHQHQQQQQQQKASMMSSMVMGGGSSMGSPSPPSTSISSTSSSLSASTSISAALSPSPSPSLSLAPSSVLKPVPTRPLTSAIAAAVTPQTTTTQVPLQQQQQQQQEATAAMSAALVTQQQQVLQQQGSSSVLPHSSNVSDNSNRAVVVAGVCVHHHHLGLNLNLGGNSSSSISASAATTGGCNAAEIHEGGVGGGVAGTLPTPPPPLGNDKNNNSSKNASSGSTTTATAMVAAANANVNASVALPSLSPSPSSSSRAAVAAITSSGSSGSSVLAAVSASVPPQPPLPPTPPAIPIHPILAESGAVVLAEGSAATVVSVPGCGITGQQIGQQQQQQQQVSSAGHVFATGGVSGGVGVNVSYVGNSCVSGGGIAQFSSSSASSASVQATVAACVPSPPPSVSVSPAAPAPVVSLSPSPINHSSHPPLPHLPHSHPHHQHQHQHLPHQQPPQPSALSKMLLTSSSPSPSSSSSLISPPSPPTKQLSKPVGQGSVPRNGLATGSTQASQVLPPSSTSNSHLSPPPSLNSPSPQHHPPLSSSSSSSLAGGGCGLGGATTPSSTNSVVQSSTLTCAVASETRDERPPQPSSAASSPSSEPMMGSGIAGGGQVSHGLVLNTSHLTGKQIAAIKTPPDVGTGPYNKELPDSLSNNQSGYPVVPVPYQGGQQQSSFSVQNPVIGGCHPSTLALGGPNLSSQGGPGPGGYATATMYSPTTSNQLHSSLSAGGGGGCLSPGSSLSSSPRPRILRKRPLEGDLNISTGSPMISSLSPGALIKNAINRSSVAVPTTSVSSHSSTTMDQGFYTIGAPQRGVGVPGSGLEGGSSVGGPNHLRADVVASDLSSSPRKKPRKQNVVPNDDQYACNVPSSLDMMGDLPPPSPTPHHHHPSSTLLPPSYTSSSSSSSSVSSSSPSSLTLLQHLRDGQQPRPQATPIRGGGGRGRKDELHMYHHHEAAPKECEVRCLAQVRRCPFPINGIYKLQHSAAYNHFRRYSDIKSREEASASLYDMADDRDSWLRMTGWRVDRFSAQLDQTIDLENSVLETVKRLQRHVCDTANGGTASVSSGGALQLGADGEGDFMDLFSELIQGSLDRSMHTLSHLSDTKAAIFSVLEHRPKATDIMRKFSSKPPPLSLSNYCSLTPSKKAGGANTDTTASVTNASGLGNNNRTSATNSITTNSSKHYNS